MTDPTPFSLEHILEFEARTYVHAGARQEAIRREFGCSLTRYTQVLYRLLEKCEEDMRRIDATTTRLLLERRARDTAAREKLAARPTPEETHP